MATAFIRLYKNTARDAKEVTDPRSRGWPAAKGPYLDLTPVTLDGASSAVPAGWHLAEIIIDAAAHYTHAAPVDTADGNNSYLPADTLIYIGVDAGEIFYFTAK